MRYLRTHRQILALLAIVAISLHALVPVGFMPNWDETEDGRFALVICTSSGPVQVPFDTTGEFDDPSHGAAATCPYFVATSDAPAPTHVVVAEVRAWPLAMPSTIYEQVVTVQRHGMPQPARGPPLHQTS